MRALPLLLLAGCAVGSAPARETAPPPDSTRAEWRLHLDTRDRGIGAYTITVRFNPEVATIEEIVPCSPKYFKGTPEYDPASFRTGVTRITALDVFGSRPRSGEWHLFTVVFRRTGPGRLVAKAELEKIYDDENKPSGGRLIDGDFQADFP